MRLFVQLYTTVVVLVPRDICNHHRISHIKFIQAGEARRKDTSCCSVMANTYGKTHDYTATNQMME